MKLQRATSADLVEIDRLSHGEWGGGRPIPVHLARERDLREGIWSRDVHCGYLIRDGYDIIASCETYRVSAATGGLGSGVGFAIASVFVPEPHRGRKLSSILLNALRDELSREPHARALVLFSDIGAPLYERLGFVALPAVDRVWRPSMSSPADGPWTLLDEAAIYSIHPHIAPVPSPVSLWPSAEQLGWHIHRAQTWAQATGAAPPSWWGASIGPDLIVWADDPAAGVLRVLLLTGHDPDSVPLLMEAAGHMAGVLGLSEVRAWETPLPGPWPDLAEREDRVGGLPMMAPLAPDIDPSEWRFIPKGCWV